MVGFRSNFLRVRVAGEEAKVDFAELFFDLVFVFAITQISHTLLAHLSLLGFLEAGLMLLAVWWVWVDTTWVTNWLDPTRPAIRAMLFSLMLVGLVLTSSIPEAFGARGLVFAICYVAMQLGRTGFTYLALSRHDRGNSLNFLRILWWQVFFSLFWIAGGFAEGDIRILLWVTALVIENLAPVFTFWVPGLGASSTADWDVEGHHMAERCGLFIIIMLGETLLLTGATFASQVWTPAIAAAFLASFVTAVAMWWLYFVHGAEQARERIAHSDDPGSIARFVYTYLHIVVVAGVILVAAGSEIALAHPLGHHVEAWQAAAMLGGPFLFLAGNALITWTMKREFPLWRFAGIIALAVFAPFSSHFEPLHVATFGAAVMLVVVVIEYVTHLSWKVA